MNTAAQNIDLRAVVYREGEWWFAHCLELDIVAEGATADEATQSLTGLCEFQIETAIGNKDLESIFRPAPAKFWNLYYTAAPKRNRRRAAGGSPPRVEAREVVLA